MIVYKLRAQDGTYVTGRYATKFGPMEKARKWKRIGDLKNHLQRRGSHTGTYLSKHVVVEECEVTETPKTYTPVSDFIHELEKKKQEKEQQRKAYQEKLEQDRRRQLYDQLKKEFDNQ
jgi:cell division FtsZ-interacting protein ZapD